MTAEQTDSASHKEKHAQQENMYLVLLHSSAILPPASRGRYVSSEHANCHLWERGSKRNSKKGTDFPMLVSSAEAWLPGSSEMLWNLL